MDEARSVRCKNRVPPFGLNHDTREEGRIIKILRMYFFFLLKKKKNNVSQLFSCSILLEGNSFLSLEIKNSFLSQFTLKKMERSRHTIQIRMNIVAGYDKVRQSTRCLLGHRSIKKKKLSTFIVSP